MKFTLPYWIISLVLSFVRVTYLFFVQGVLMLYVKYSRDSYASSIRWSRTGGITEMLQLLWNSYRSIPKRSSAAMLLAVIATLSTMSVSSILTSMVSRVDEERNPDTAGVLTKQLISMDPLFWSTDLSSESTVEEALMSMLNDTLRNPSPRPRVRYTPRTYTYKTACDESIAIFMDDGLAEVPFPFKTNNCKAHILPIGDVVLGDLRNASNFIFDSSTFMLFTSAVRPNAIWSERAIEPTLVASGMNQVCASNTFDMDLDAMFTEFLENGLIVPPKTLATKCQYGSEEESLVLSVTYLQFAVGSIQEYDKVRASIVDDPGSLPLLEYMKSAIDKGIFENPTNNSTLVMLTKNPSTSSDIDFFLCLSIYRKEQGTMGLICTYMLTSVTIVSPQAIDPAITADLPRRSEARNKYNATDQIDFTIHHLPRDAKKDRGHGLGLLFSSAQLINATTGAARYLASLGHNVYTFEDQDSQTDQLYILYDTVEIIDAYEVSTAAFVVVCVLCVLFVFVWIISECLRAVYTCSLYKTIYEELKTRDEAVPMLMRYTRSRMAFDGNRVIYNPDDLQDEACETQDHAMVSLQRCNIVQDNHQEHQSLESLDETTVYCPSTTSMSTAISVPIASSATSASIAITTNATQPPHPTQSQAHRSSNLSVPPPILRRSRRFEYDATSSS